MGLQAPAPQHSVSITLDTSDATPDRGALPPPQEIMPDQITLETSSFTLAASSSDPLKARERKLGGNGSSLQQGRGHTIDEKSSTECGFDDMFRHLEYVRDHPRDHRL